MTFGSPPRLLIAISLGFAALAADAQRLYQWTDETGRVNITDTPPPPSARDVQIRKPSPVVKDSGQTPFDLAKAMKDFPVTLYTSPPCKAACDEARAALNKRGVPFKEVQVWDEETHERLKSVAGSSKEVPVLTVGRSVQKGFEQSAYDALLDSARYPKEGAAPAGTQPAPKLPEGYVAPTEREALKAEPIKPEESKPLGPYAPGAPPQRSQQR